MINDKKINFWLWAGWVGTYLQRSLSAQVNLGIQMPPRTKENSQFLRSGSQEVSLVMSQFFRFSDFVIFAILLLHSASEATLKNLGK